MFDFLSAANLFLILGVGSYPCLSVFIYGLTWVFIGVPLKGVLRRIHRRLNWGLVFSASICIYLWQMCHDLGFRVLPCVSVAQWLLSLISMKLHALATRRARIAPKKIHVAWPLLIMTVLYWLSSISGTPLPDNPKINNLFYWISPSLQNALHVPAYAAQAWAWRWALGAWLRVSSARAIGACTIASAYGVFDEWRQSFVPGRYASFTDVVLDVAGAALGIWLAAWIGSGAITIKEQTETDKRT